MGFRGAFQMIGEYDQFIGVYKDLCPEGLCDHLISEYERLSNLGVARDRGASECGVSPHLKEDEHIFSNTFNDYPLEEFKGNFPDKIFFESMDKAIQEYAHKYSPLNIHPMSCKSIKFQKTSRQEGYHVWHYENGNPVVSNRAVTYMLYLNTIPLGSGETEFLYQEKRIHPTANTLVLWPTGFTHTHRGNAVYGDTPKYVVTGWFNYDE
jgi:hypothetical protein